MELVVSELRAHAVRIGDTQRAKPKNRSLLYNFRKRNEEEEEKEKMLKYALHFFQIERREKKKDHVTKSGEIVDQNGSLEPFHYLGNGI